MSFLYVDRILEYVPGQRIRGLKNVTRSEPLLLPGDAGKRVMHAPVLIEAFAQMSAWLAILDHRFEKRPLFLGEDDAQLFGDVESGDQVELSVELGRYNEEVVETHGTAKVRGKTVFRSDCGRGFLVPMTDFDDPKVVEKRFSELYRPDLKAGPKVEAMPDESHAKVWTLSRQRPTEFVDAVISIAPLVEAQTLKNVTVSEAYFLEHFPRRPVVPGVVLLSMMLDACEMLVRTTPEPIGSRRYLTLQRLVGARFRKIVEPGDQCVVKVKTKSWDPVLRRLVVSAAVFANDYRVTQVELTLKAKTTLPAELIVPTTTGQAGTDASAI